MKRALTSGILRAVGLLGLLLGSAVALWCWRAPTSPARSGLQQLRDISRLNSTGHESAEAVTATAKGFVVIGDTNSRKPGVRQAWVLQFEGTSLRPRHQRTFGAAAGGLARAVTATADGGVLVAGEVEVAPDRYQPWLLALGADGEPRWERTPGSAGLNGFNAVARLADGTVVAGGILDRAGSIVRISEAGEAGEAGEALGELRLPQLDSVTALAALSGQRFAVAGISETSTVGLSTSSVRVFSAGDQLEWQWALPAPRRGELHALAAMPDGGLVAAGRLQRPGRSGAPDWGLWVVRLDAKGSVLWEHRSDVAVDAAAGHDADAAADAATIEAGYAVVVLPDGGVAVAGDCIDLQGKTDRDARLWRFEPGGALRWRKSYGGAEQDLARGLALLPDGSFVAVGSTMSRGAGKTDLWVLRLTAEGELLEQETFGGP